MSEPYDKPMLLNLAVTHCTIDNPAIKDVIIQYCPTLEQITVMHSLDSFMISGCESLVCIEYADNISIRQFYMSDCPISRYIFGADNIDQVCMARCCSIDSTLQLYMVDSITVIDCPDIIRVVVCSDVKYANLTGCVNLTIIDIDYCERIPVIGTLHLPDRPVYMNGEYADLAVVFTDGMTLDDIPPDVSILDIERYSGTSLDLSSFRFLMCLTVDDTDLEHIVFPKYIDVISMNEGCMKSLYLPKYTSFCSCTDNMLEYVRIESTGINIDFTANPNLLAISSDESLCVNYVNDEDDFTDMLELGPYDSIRTFGDKNDISILYSNGYVLRKVYRNMLARKALHKWFKFVHKKKSHYRIVQINSRPCGVVGQWDVGGINFQLDLISVCY